MSALPGTSGTVPTYTTGTASYFYTNFWAFANPHAPTTIPAITIAGSTTVIPWYILL
jgi:hypothetical protein